MKKVKSAVPFILFFVLGTFFFSTTANAYIDPSAMTYIVQVIVGIVIACGAALGFYLKKIKRVFKKEDKPVESHVEQVPSNFENDDEFDQLNGKNQ